MPGDPKECRQHALNCVHLAKGASAPEQRDHFAKLARTWIKLAEELEQTQAFLAAIEDETEPEVGPGGSRRIEIGIGDGRRAARPSGRCAVPS